MRATAREPWKTPAAWLGSEIQADPGWTLRLDAAQRDEIEAALRHARARGRTLDTLRREDFPLPNLARDVAAWVRELDSGRGFVLLKGFPVERLAHEDVRLAYYGLGLHLGTPVSQNADGDRLGDVRDLGIDSDHPSVRLYKTRKRQDFHTDGSDVVGLLCLRGAKSGGISRIVSSVAIHDEILRRRPDLIEVLYQPIAFDRNDEQRPGEKPYFELPICRDAGGRLRTFYIGWYIRSAQRHEAAPRLSRAQNEALELVEALANDPRFYLDMDFEPGDIQWLENAVILHSRSEYEDWDEPERKRHLLRLWLTAHDFTSVEAELRQGIARRDAG